MIEARPFSAQTVPTDHHKLVGEMGKSRLFSYKPAHIAQ
jgi:hypothetical protein